MLQSLDTVILIIDLSPGYFHDQLFDGLVCQCKKNGKITLQSTKWHLQIAYIVQPKVQRLLILSENTET